MNIDEVKDIKQTFQDFDADGSGGISQSELKAAIGSLKQTVMPADRILRKMISSYSRKEFKDGKELDFKAFEALIKAVKDGTFEAKVKEEDKKIKALFEEMDADESNSISPTEMKTALEEKNPHEKGADTKANWPRILEFADMEPAGGGPKEFSFTAFQKLMDEVYVGKFS